jgi:hypothetical protein
VIKPRAAAGGRPACTELLMQHDERRAGSRDP